MGFQMPALYTLTCNQGLAHDGLADEGFGVPASISLEYSATLWLMGAAPYLQSGGFGVQSPTRREEEIKTEGDRERSV